MHRTFESPPKHILGRHREYSVAVNSSDGNGNTSWWMKQFAMWNFHWIWFRVSNWFLYLIWKWIQFSLTVKPHSVCALPLPLSHLNRFDVQRTVATGIKTILFVQFNWCSAIERSENPFSQSTDIPREPVKCWLSKGIIVLKQTHILVRHPSFVWRENFDSIQYLTWADRKSMLPKLSQRV